MKKKPTIALMYDFDKTLADQDMQNYSFIPNLGMTAGEFWGKVETFRNKNYMESILGYMYYSMIACKEKGILFLKDPSKAPMGCRFAEEAKPAAAKGGPVTVTINGKAYGVEIKGDGKAVVNGKEVSFSAKAGISGDSGKHSYRKADDRRDRKALS